jgi:hypothetical protein
MRPLLSLVIVTTACGASPASPAHHPSAPPANSKLVGCPPEATTGTEAPNVSDVTDVKLVSAWSHRATSPNDSPYGTEPTDAFFPPGVDAFTRRWYGKHLAAMCEPSLWRMPGRPAFVLRFLWLRTFDNPIAVRVVQTASTASLTVMRLGGAGGFDPGAIDARRERNLTQAEWEGLRRGLQADLDAPVPEVFGADGAQWILEIRTKDSYRTIERWSPDMKGPGAEFRRFCELLLDYAGRDLIKGDVY